MTFMKRLKGMVSGTLHLASTEPRCLTRYCFKGYHDDCSGTAALGWLSSQPCTCKCHKD